MYNTSNFNNKQTNQNEVEMNELEKFLETLFGDGLFHLNDGEIITKELVLSRVKNIMTENSSLSEARTKAEGTIQSLEAEIDQLKKSIKANEIMVSIGSSHLSETRTNCIASYKKLVGDDKVDENIISLLESETTNIETLKSLKKTYDLQLEEKFPMTCKKCGSKDVSRASSVDPKSDDDTTMSNSDIVSDIRKIADSKLK